MKAIPDVVLLAVANKFGEKGQQFKLRHPFKTDGSVCTPSSKNPAMTVTRGDNCWLFYCHRCACSGSIPDLGLSPAQTSTKINRIPLNKNIEFSEVVLPIDFEPLKQKYNDQGNKIYTNIPYNAFNWPARLGIIPPITQKYEFGWSNFWQRVIIPLYEFRVLVGWIGRCVESMTKEKRKEKGKPKSITRTQKDKRRYFRIEGTVINRTVIVEDIMSAIKVHEATGYGVVALLNSKIGDDLFTELMNQTTYVWLDPNMRLESVRQVNRMNSLGIKSKHVISNKDPKDHDLLEIQGIIRDRN